MALFASLSNLQYLTGRIFLRLIIFTLIKTQNRAEKSGGIFMFVGVQNILNPAMPVGCKGLSIVEV